MSPVFATTSFSVSLPGGGVDNLQLGDERDSNDPTVLAAPGLFSATPPTAGTVGAEQEGYLQTNPFGPNDPAQT